MFGRQVLKFLMEKNSTNALHGQVTIGTLILQVLNLFPLSPFCNSASFVSISFMLFGLHIINLNCKCYLLLLSPENFFVCQDCAVGLLFALLPVLGGTSGIFQAMISITKLYDPNFCNIPCFWLISLFFLSLLILILNIYESISLMYPFSVFYYLGYYRIWILFPIIRMEYNAHNSLFSSFWVFCQRYCVCRHHTLNVL